MRKALIWFLWAFLTPRGWWFRRIHWQPLSEAGAFRVDGAEYVPDTSTLSPMAETDAEAAGSALPAVSVARGTPAAPEASKQTDPCPVLAFEPILKTAPAVAEPAEQAGRPAQVADDNMLNYAAPQLEAPANQEPDPVPSGALDVIAMRLEFAHFYFKHDDPASAAGLLEYVEQHGDAEQMARAKRLRAEFTAG